MPTKKMSVCLFSSLLCLIPARVIAQEPGVAEVINNGRTLEFMPLVEYQQLVLSVTGPCNFVFEKAFTPRDGNPVFELTQETIDGRYRYDLVVIPKIDPRIVTILRQARKKGDDTVANQLCREGALPGAPESQSQGFAVANAEIIFDPKSEEPPPGKSGDNGSLAGTLSAAADVAGGGASFPAKDFVIIDDLIVDGSACIGFDCVNGESFGFDTLRLKENNLRIKFDDTSTASSYPRNDWQLTANDSANGGLSKFSIDDISGNRTPFTIEANARSHSLYVDDGGRIGSRTSTPSLEIHTIDGDTPALRLQQDGSSGFAPQTWDIAGNETNFFVRDVTNGSALPFRIRPGAPSSSIFIDVDGKVGLRTSSPQDALHIQSVSGENSTVRYVNGDATSDFWRLGLNGSEDFVINYLGDSTAELRVSKAGALFVSGTQMTVPDYVFAPEYDLMSLEELEAFIAQNRHLPNVPPAAEMETEGINMTQLQLSLLEKVEELTLYTLQLKKELEALKLQNAALVAGQAAPSDR